VLGVLSRVNTAPVRTWVLPCDLSAPGEARGYVEVACAGISEETVYTARLLVTELVSNAVIHGRGPVLLTVARERASVHVAVHDESPRLPKIIAGPPLSEHGAGLRLVSALAGSWGTDPSSEGQPGKSVWFTLP
jgi:anti-sigma regulatory factor (Ser/Thr protein kinase)